MVRRKVCLTKQKKDKDWTIFLFRMIRKAKNRPQNIQSQSSYLNYLAERVFSPLTRMP